MEQYYNTKQRPIQPGNRKCKARESKKYLLLFLLTGHQTLFSKNCQFMKQLLRVQDIILSAMDDDGDDAGDDANDNDSDAYCDYDQGYEC